MTPTELEKLLGRAKLSQRKAARLLDIDERTMRRYVLGEYPIPRAIELAVRYLASHPEENR